MDKREKEFLRGIFLIVLFVCVVWKFPIVIKGVKFCFSLISPLVYGCVIAFILNLIVKQLEKYMRGGIWKNKSFKRGISIVLSLIIFVGVIAAIMAGLVPEIIKSAKVLQLKLPIVIQSTAEYLESNFQVSGYVLDYMKNFEFSGELFQGLLENELVMNVVKTGGDVIGSVFGVITRFLIGFFFAFYILMQKEELECHTRRMIVTYLPEQASAVVLDFCHEAYTVYSNFITGQCVDAVILGMMVMIAQLILRIPYPVLNGVIIAVTALIPVVGAFIGGAVGMFLIAIESPMQSILFLILFLVLQQIDNRIIYPRVVGSAVGLPSIWVFAAIVIGGNISGVAGMFLGIPLAALLYAFLGEDLKRREQKKLEQEKEQDVSEDAE